VLDVDPDEFSKTRRFRAPVSERKFETVGGGFIVVERTRKKNRLRPSMWPLELASYQDAARAVIRLQKKHPEKSFAILEQVGFAPAPEIRNAQ
jgi:hypothetical protein